MRPSWDEYFGYLVQVVSWRSDDEETKVGAVIVDNKNRLVSVGYNGTPRGTDLPHTRAAGKYVYMVHSEPNCIITASRNIEGCKMYVLGMLPCCDCAKLICQAGLTEVIVVNRRDPTGKDWNFDATLEMFRQCKITTRDIIVPKVVLQPS